MTTHRYEPGPDDERATPTGRAPESSGRSPDAPGPTPGQSGQPAIYGRHGWQDEGTTPPAAAPVPPQSPQSPAPSQWAPAQWAPAPGQPPAASPAPGQPPAASPGLGQLPAQRRPAGPGQQPVPGPQPPALGQQPPTLGQQPPALGQQPPALGQQQPPASWTAGQQTRPIQPGQWVQPAQPGTQGQPGPQAQLSHQSPLGQQAQLGQPAQPGQQAQVGPPAQFGQPAQSAQQPAQDAGAGAALAQPRPAGQTRPTPAGATTAVVGTTSAGQTTHAIGLDATQAAARAQEAQASAAAQAGAAARAAAAPEAPHRPPGGTVYGSRSPERQENGHAPMSGRLHRLRIGSHTASFGALARIGVSSPGTGLVLGADRDQRPVLVRLFRPEPTRVTLIGGSWPVQVVAFRALALGARVAIATLDPAAWQGFGEWATGRSDRVAVVPATQPIALSGTPNEPALVVYDVGSSGPVAASPPGAWQTQLVVLRQLSTEGLAAIQECDLVMLQRLHASEVNLAATALGLSEQSGQLLQMMEDDMLALLGGGADRYVWLTPTDVEQQFSRPLAGMQAGLARP